MWFDFRVEGIDIISAIQWKFIFLLVLETSPVEPLLHEAGSNI